MPSVMKHQFSQVPAAEIPRSQFDRSHGNKTTFSAGELVPIFIDEALPGDTFNSKMTAFARLATPLHPFMDNMFLETFFFAVPYRLLWDNWEKFNGAQDNPDDTTDYLIPTCPPPAGGWANGSIGDYFGIPTDIFPMELSALPFRAYNLIYNEWFRDENLQDSVLINKGDGPDVPTDYTILKRGKRHDYFTSALPWPQKGPAIDVPLGSTAPIINDGNPMQFATDAAGTDSQDANIINNIIGTVTPPAQNGALAYLGTDSGMVADLTEATASTINQLRQAFQIQKLYERDARGGTRYTEIVKAHFGVTSPDARLQRPEFLGGGSSALNINPIAQTSAADTQPTPQGNLAAMGTSLLNNHSFTKSFTEHSVVIGLVCARADLNYQQGLNKMWSRQTRWDFYWPALSHIGEQAILNQEIYAQGTAEDTEVFGYQERFAEYRYKPSTITGQFRSNYAQTLDTWHLAQDFETLPTLSSEFIEENPPVERVIAVPSEPDFLMDMYFQLQCARPMPVYSVPGLIDHF